MGEDGVLLASLLDSSQDSLSIPPPPHDALCDNSADLLTHPEHQEFPVCYTSSYTDTSLPTDLFPYLEPLESLLTFGFQPTNTEKQDIVFEYYVQGDPQNESLYGEWSIWKSSIAKEFAPAAIRGIGLSFGGPAVEGHLSKQAAEHEMTIDHPLIKLHSGDLGDKGCPVEPDLAWASMVDKPDAITPGNHLEHQGFMTDENDIWGATPRIFGLSDYVVEIWDPSCGGDHLTKWEWIEAVCSNIYGVDAKAIEVRLAEVSPEGYQIEGENKKLWGAPENSSDVVQDFWYRSENLDLCIVKMTGEGYDPENDVIILAVVKKRVTLPDDSERIIHTLVIDGMDYLDGKPPIPGMDPGFSSTQSTLWLHYIDSVIKKEAQALSPAVMGHQRLVDYYDPKTGSLAPWENLMPVLLESGADIYISGHKHKPLIDEIDHEHGFAGKIVDHTASSTIDFPAGGMRLIAQKDPEDPDGFIFERADVGIDFDRLIITDRVLEKYREHEEDLLAYQLAADELPKEMREMLNLPKDDYLQWATTAIEYIALNGALYDNPDILINCAHVQELQFVGMLKYLHTVIELLDDDNASIREALEQHVAELEVHYDQWKQDFDQYKADYSAYQETNFLVAQYYGTHDSLVTRGRELLNLFSYDHDDGTPCVTEVQFLVREIPMETEADTFKVLMALRTGWEEHLVEEQKAQAAAQLRTEPTQKPVKQSPKPLQGSTGFDLKKQTGFIMPPFQQLIQNYGPLPSWTTSTTQTLGLEGSLYTYLIGSEEKKPLSK